MNQVKRLEVQNGSVPGELHKKKDLLKVHQQEAEDLREHNIMMGRNEKGMDFITKRLCSISRSRELPYTHVRSEHCTPWLIGECHKL